MEERRRPGGRLEECRRNRAKPPRRTAPLRMLVRGNGHVGRLMRNALAVAPGATTAQLMRPALTLEA